MAVQRLTKVVRSSSGFIPVLAEGVHVDEAIEKLADLEYKEQKGLLLPLPVRSARLYIYPSIDAFTAGKKICQSIVHLMTVKNIAH
ncbi:MAG: hypothetical protein NC218_02105 [Acetobacter sp.]|nr:hypothetical protein [Acetobacter sp.]